MPKTKRDEPLYQRGERGREFRLFPRPGRNHEIIWYDPATGRERTASAGTTEIQAATAALDAKYLEITQGIQSCPTCRRPFTSARGRLVTEAIELARHVAEGKDSEDAINSRLDHVVDYIETLPSPEVYCAEVSEKWIETFRSWLLKQPMVSTAGRVLDRQRAASTVENSVIQLAAAIRGIGEEPAFKPIPTTQVNRTPQHRSDVAELARMFRYCLYPEDARSPEETARRRRERVNLLRFLRATVATWARPDAVLDINTSRDRGQWHPQASVLALNPVGRRQTRKRRATVPVAKQFAPHLNDVDGPYIPVGSIKSAWQSMADDLNLPGDGEAGTKLVRRSVMTIARRRLGEEHWIQGRMMAGHVPVNISDLYALFDPANLGRALAVTESIIDEIEALAPGAFYRDLTAQGGNVASIARAKSA